MPSKLFEGQGEPIIKHKQHQTTFKDSEYIGDIFGSSSTYNQYVYRVNPGVARTFSILSSLISCYIEYRFEYLEFFINPVATSLVNDTNLLLGWYGMVFVTDSYQPPFTNKTQLLEYHGSVVTKVSKSLRLIIDLKNIMGSNYFYVSQGSDYLQDERLTDLGNLVIAVGSNRTDQGQIGELYCSYKVSARKVRPLYSLGATTIFAHYFITSPTISKLFGTAQTAQQGSNLNMAFGTGLIPSIGNAQGSYMLFPDVLLGIFSITISIQGSGTAWSFGTFNTSGNAKFDQNFYNGNGKTINTGNSSNMVITLMMVIPEPGNQYTQNGQLSSAATYLAFDTSGTLVTAIQSMDVVITQISSYA